ncbi:bifunctional metallophosphatase/5'-nucleotidase [Peribacillus saganii]|uniref:Bifunctional metallophosphatase/5'-nucleotidase n=1 Tax=Peribacillus saganii TaxID=2303992 RepID=A0A372LMW2_9BACI|nr:5'-nucleotidase C-terminal domain-containing protein [Peribacillus saganii]RFU68732.1 bifunctional metallophosphatase/5'-nucleotidase [Peribacillus saganii]
MNNISKRNIIIGALLAVGIIAPQVVSDAAEAQKNKELDRFNQGIPVQLLGINDFHGQIETYRKVNGKQTGGAEYLAAYLKKHEKQNKNTFLVHAGDIVGGSSPASALLKDEPTIQVLNKIGFDIGTLGNHEFDEGISELKRLIDGGHHHLTGEFEGADFPYVAANVIDKATGKPILPRYVIKKANGIPIGFIGVVTQETKSIVHPSAVEEVEFMNEKEAIDEAVTDLKNRGVRSIIVLAHNRAASHLDGTSPKGEAVELAKTVNDEVDIILGGHNHTYANTLVDGKLVVQAYAYGTAFSDIDIVIDPNTKDIVKKSARVIRTFHEGINADQEVKNMVDIYKAEIAPLVNRNIGTSATPFTVKKDASGESALGNFIADVNRETMASNFALMNPGGIRADLDAGIINWGELHTMQPFGNRLVKMTLTGGQMKEVLEQQFSFTDQKVLHVSGLTYSFNRHAPAGNKIVNLTDSRGRELVADKEYTVTVTSFLAFGGDGFTVLTEGTDQVTGPPDIEAIADYIQKQSEPIIAPALDRIKVQ